MVYLDVDFLCKMALSKINLDSAIFVFIDILKNVGKFDKIRIFKNLDMDIFKKCGILKLNLDKPFWMEVYEL